MESLTLLCGTFKEEGERESEGIVRKCKESVPILSQLKREVVEEEKRAMIFEHQNFLKYFLSFFKRVVSDFRSIILPTG